MTLSSALVAPQTTPPGGTSPWNRQLSGPGDSSSRSRSLISIPSLPARSGGSVQARATRRVPNDTARPPPASAVVLGELTTNVCVTQPAPVAQLIGELLLIGGSPVARSS